MLKARLNIQLTDDDLLEHSERVFIDNNGYSSDRLRSRFAVVLPGLKDISDDAFDVLLIMIINKNPKYIWHYQLNLLMKHLIRRDLDLPYSSTVMDDFQYSPMYTQLMDKFTVGQLTGTKVRKSRSFNRLVQDIVLMVKVFLDQRDGSDIYGSELDEAIYDQENLGEHNQLPIRTIHPVMEPLVHTTFDIRPLR